MSARLQSPTIRSTGDFAHHRQASSEFLDEGFHRGSGAGNRLSKRDFTWFTGLVWSLDPVGHLLDYRNDRSQFDSQITQGLEFVDITRPRNLARGFYSTAGFVLYRRVLGREMASYDPAPDSKFPACNKAGKSEFAPQGRSLQLVRLPPLKAFPKEVLRSLVEQGPGKCDYRQDRLRPRCGGRPPGQRFANEFQAAVDRICHRAFPLVRCAASMKVRSPSCNPSGRSGANS